MPKSAQYGKFLKTHEAINIFLKSMPDLILIQDRYGVYIDYFTQNNNVLIDPPDAFIGKNMHEFLPHDLVKEITPLFNEVIDKKELRIYEYSLNLDGVTKYFETRMNLYNEDKVLSIVRDISDKVKAEKENNIQTWHF